VVACFAADLATHCPPRFHTAEQRQLTNRVGAAAVAYLLVLVLALMVVVIVIFVVMPIMIKWETRSDAANQHAGATPLTEYAQYCRAPRGQEQLRSPAAWTVIGRPGERCVAPTTSIDLGQGQGQSATRPQSRAYTTDTGGVT
jgi:hypothetical protein